MKKFMVIFVLVLLLIPLILYGESKTVAEGKKDTTYYKVKVHADGKEETSEFVNQQNSKMSRNERVAEKDPVQSHITQMTYYISIELHSPVTVKAFKLNSDGTKGSELSIWESKYTPTPPMAHPIKKMIVQDCYGDTQLEFTGTSEAVPPNDHYWWKVSVDKSDGTSTTPQKIGSKENPIPIKPGEIHKAIITSDGEIRPFFTGEKIRK